MATGNSVAYTLSSAETALYKKTNTEVLEAMKTFTEEWGWTDDTPDIRIAASANEMRLVVDVNYESGVADIPEGGYEAIATSVDAENGTLSPIQLNARYSFSTLQQKGWGPAKAGQIENEVIFKAMKKTQAISERIGLQFYGYSTGYVAVVKTTQSAGATQLDIPLKDPFGDTGIDDTSTNGLTYLTSLFRGGCHIALVRSGAIVEIGTVAAGVTGTSGVGYLSVVFNASCTPTAGDQIVFAEQVTDATLGGTSYNHWTTGYLDFTQSASLHGIATSSVPGWASYVDSSGGRWSVAKQKKMAQRAMNNGGAVVNRMLMDQGVERDVLAGESAARRYAPGDTYDLDASFKAKGMKVMSSRLTPPGVVGMWANSAWTKKLLNEKPPEEGGPDLFTIDKVQDRGLLQASLDFIYFRAGTNRAAAGLAVGLTQQ